MSGLLITIVGVFFTVGITVGVITIIALSALRAGRRGQPRYGPEQQPGYAASRPGELPAEPGPDGTVLEEPRWPGDADNDFSSR